MLWNEKKEKARNIFKNKVRWKHKLSRFSASIQRGHHRSYLYYFLLGAALKIPEKATNPFIIDGFLDETQVQRGLQGCVSLLSLSHGERGRVIRFSSTAASWGLLGWSSLWRQLGRVSLWKPVPDLEIAGEEHWAMFGSVAVERNLAGKSCAVCNGLCI